MNAQIELPRPSIEAFCRKWKISRLEIFGSVLRDDFKPSSDVDFLLSFDLDAHWTLFDMVDMEQEMETLLGRKVDLVSRLGIENSRNWIRKKDILDSAEVYYAA